MRKAPANGGALRRIKRNSKPRKSVVCSQVIFDEPSPVKRKSPFAEEPDAASTVKRSCMSPLRGSALTTAKATTVPNRK